MQISQVLQNFLQEMTLVASIVYIQLLQDVFCHLLNFLFYFNYPVLGKYW